MNKTIKILKKCNIFTSPLVLILPLDSLLGEWYVPVLIIVILVILLEAIITFRVLHKHKELLEEYFEPDFYETVEGLITPIIGVLLCLYLGQYKWIIMWALLFCYGTYKINM